MWECMKKRLLLLLLCAGAQRSQAYLYNAIVMRKWLPEQNRYHYYIGLGDYHDATCAADTVHRDEVESLLRRPWNQGLRVITEDLTSPNAEGRCGVKGIRINKFEGAFLGGITEVCRAAGADAVNLEFRYARLASLGPVLHSDKELSALFATNKLLVEDLIQEVERELAGVATFRDGVSLNQWYACEAKAVRSAMNRFGWPSCAAQTVAAYLASLSVRLKPYIDKSLIRFDRTILDVKIVHDIVSRTDVERTCVIAGGSHIERVAERLKQIGYEVVLQLDPTFPFFSNLSAFLQSGAKPVPHPIDLSKLDSFF